jgi:hypothetical protein
LHRSAAFVSLSLNSTARIACHSSAADPVCVLLLLLLLPPPPLLFHDMRVSPVTTRSFYQL